MKWTEVDYVMRNKGFVSHPIRQKNILICWLMYKTMIANTLWALVVQETLIFTQSTKDENMTQSKTAACKQKISYMGKHYFIRFILLDFYWKASIWQ